MLTVTEVMYPTPELATSPKSITVVRQAKEVLARAQLSELWFNRKSISVLKGRDWWGQVWYLVRTGQEQDPNLAPAQDPQLGRTLQCAALGMELFYGGKRWGRRKTAWEADKSGRWKLRHLHSWESFSVKPNAGVGRWVTPRRRGLGGRSVYPSRSGSRGAAAAPCHGSPGTGSLLGAHHVPVPGRAVG